MKRVGGRRKEKARVHELVRGFGHPRANDRTDAANQGDAVQSELRNRTNRELPNQFMNQFASSPANVRAGDGHLLVELGGGEGRLALEPL